MTSPALQKEPRTLRQTLGDTQAEIDALFGLVARHYEAIDTLGNRIRELEERAATLGEELIRRPR